MAERETDLRVNDFWTDHGFGLGGRFGMRPVRERLAARSFFAVGLEAPALRLAGMPAVTARAGGIFKKGLRHNASLSLKHWDFPGFGKISHGLFTRPQISPMFMRVS